MVLARCLAGLRDFGIARGFLADRLATLGPPSFAHALEPLVAGAAAGNEVDRGAMVLVASWIAHACARGEEARLHAIGAAAAEAGLPLTRALFAEGKARAALARGARLAEVGIAVFADFSGLPPRYEGQSVEDWRKMRAWYARAPDTRRWTMRSRVERARMHHDPIFIGRLLDQRWVFVSDAVIIAARRPAVPGILLAVATRDRWFCCRPVREALRENPYAPPMLSRALG